MCVQAYVCMSSLEEQMNGVTCHATCFYEFSIKMMGPPEKVCHLVITHVNKYIL